LLIEMVHGSVSDDLGKRATTRMSVAATTTNVDAEDSPSPEWPRRSTAGTLTKVPRLEEKMCRPSERVYRERFSVVLSVILLMVMGACASGGAGRRSEPSAVDDGAETSFGPTHVVVSNQSWQRVTVYITQGSMLWRLGDVEARSDATLPLKNVGRSLIAAPRISSRARSPARRSARRASRSARAAVCRSGRSRITRPLRS
jgi:hypothetical protein